MNMGPFSSASIEKAREAGKKRRDAGIWATDALYDRDQDRLVLKMATGWELAVDRKKIEEFRNVLPEKMRDIRLSPAGTALHLDDLDIHISIVGLIAEIISINIFAQAVGRQGGMVTSEAKSTAARLNGARGGRPKKQKEDLKVCD